jgi:3-deoxy-7-phosphoheptulonate synthase
MPHELLVTQDAGNTRGVRVGPDLVIGGGKPVVCAGPCSVESRAQILDTARAVRAAGAHMLRGGAFKPRTSPYTFQGLGEEGLILLAEAREATGLPVVTEVMDAADVPAVAAYADMLQLGARSMQNFPLLRALGKVDKPILLKRGPAATLEEWLHAAEYIYAGGNGRVVLCERGIRTFETYTRNTLDLGSALAARQLTHLPVMADPSHGCGRRNLVVPLAKAAIAAGLDGVMIEVHIRPDEAWSDREQAIDAAEFQAFMKHLGLTAPSETPDSDRARLRDLPPEWSGPRPALRSGE